MSCSVQSINCAPRAQELRAAVLARQGGEPARRRSGWRPLREQIGLALARHAHVRQEEVQHGTHQGSAFHDSNGRDPEALAVDVGGGSHRARLRTPHVRVVRTVRAVEVRARGSREVHRRDQGDVRQVRAARVGIVQQHDVPGTHLDPLDRGLVAHGGRAQMHRLVRGLADHAPVAVEQRAGEVAPLLDVGRERRALQRGAHLLRDGREQVVEDLESKRIESRHAQRSSSGKSSTS